VRFTWDPKKAASNLKKHGVSFVEVVSVFADPLAAMLDDALDPARAILVGQSEKGRVLLVVFIEHPRTRSASSARDALRPARGSVMKKATGKKLLGPSRASLREMPEVNFDKAKVRRNPYALRIAAEGISIHVGRGRPRKGTETGPTVPRSVRFPARVWRHLEKRATAQGIPLHDLSPGHSHRRCYAYRWDRRR